jgi:hypothetical protein
MGTRRENYIIHFGYPSKEKQYSWTSSTTVAFGIAIWAALSKNNAVCAAVSTTILPQQITFVAPSDCRSLSRRSGSDELLKCIVFHCNKVDTIVKVLFQGSIQKWGTATMSTKTKPPDATKPYRYRIVNGWMSTINIIDGCKPSVGSAWTSCTSPIVYVTTKQCWIIYCCLGLTVLNQNNGGNGNFSPDSFLPKQIQSKCAHTY